MKRTLVLAMATAVFLTGCATVHYPPPAPRKHGVYHAVRKNETLWTIAKGYSLPIRSIIDNNNIPNANQIEIGQLLFIPDRSKVIHADLAAPVRADEAFVWPLKGKVISYFGATKSASRNKGIDISAPMGTNIVASRSGTVSFCTDVMEGYGKTIIIDHAGGFQTVYAYNMKNFVREGDRVRQNQVIAKVGKGGRAVASSLHFEIRKNHEPENPFYYLP